jgi:hypothetical protein
VCVGVALFYKGLDWGLSIRDVPRLGLGPKNNDLAVGPFSSEYPEILSTKSINQVSTS